MVTKKSDGYFGMDEIKPWTPEQVARYGKLGIFAVIIMVIAFTGWTFYVSPALSAKAINAETETEQETGGLKNLFGANADTIAIATETGTFDVPVITKNKYMQVVSPAVEIKKLRYDPEKNEITGEAKSLSSETIRDIDLLIFDSSYSTVETIAQTQVSAPEKGMPRGNIFAFSLSEKAKIEFSKLNFEIRLSQ